MVYAMPGRFTLDCNLTEDIIAGKGRMEDLDTCRINPHAGTRNTFCALALSHEPLQSALKYFREDFERYIVGNPAAMRLCNGPHRN